MGLSGLNFWKTAAAYVVQRPCTRLSCWRSRVRIPVESVIKFFKFQFPIQKTHQETQNDPESTITTFFGQNQPKPVFPVEIDQILSFWLKPSFSSQNRPKPLCSAKINQNQFFRSNPSFSDQSWQRPVFSAKIDRNHFFRLNPTSFSTSFFWSNP